VFAHATLHPLAELTEFVRAGFDTAAYGNLSAGADFACRLALASGSCVARAAAPRLSTGFASRPLAEFGI